MKNCTTMPEVRAEIDRIDREIVPLLLERLEYIAQAGHIKADRNTVRDEDRVEDVVQKALTTAEKLNGNATYIEDVYRYLIEWSINYEFGVWDKVAEEK
ncbi:chorismate mutase [Kordiimonas sp. SCSIO 12610]|uniref:chorismate mutase n=1 Tax=Kordiimonas sp. SCSIO 12610 TaxID=2829597 RepID=UPI00210C64B3|nr:chorismate mutase [Kordiimonas sp. SCSIO 12610]